MPNYRGHLVGGLAVYCIVLAVLVGFIPSVVTGFEWLLFTLAGALFPDIDIKSKGQKYFYYLVFIALVVLMYQQKFRVASCFSFFAITPMLTKHRGIFHNPFFVVALPLSILMAMSMLFPALSWPLFFDTIFFIAGSLSHLFLDGCLSSKLQIRSRKRR